VTIHRVGIQRDPRTGRIIGVGDTIKMFSPNSKITVVAGPPSGRKTTFVEKHRGKYDLVIDLDKIAVALGSPESHGHLKSLWPFIWAAAEAVIDLCQEPNQIPHIWIIRGAPLIEQRHGWPGSRVVVLETPERQARRWALDAERPDEWGTLIRNWWLAYEPDDRDEIIRLDEDANQLATELESEDSDEL
jgi:hypothetical protein